jgi:hypothetical protein
MSAHGETATDWPEIIAVSANGAWRLALSNDTAPTVQWLLQKRRTATRWQTKLYCQTRAGLELHVPPRPAMTPC